MQKGISFLCVVSFITITIACQRGEAILSKEEEPDPEVKSVDHSLKARIKGFVLRGDADGHPGFRNHYDDPNTSEYDFGLHVDGIVVQVEWAHLQPEAGGEIIENNIIDQAIAAIEQWNNENANHPLGIKLRVFSGIYAPTWVADTTNGFMVYYKNGKEGMLPKYWWANRYCPLWEDLQLKLAAKYDEVDIIREVAVSGVMTHNAETMWRNPGDLSRPDGRTNIEIMRENGLTLAKDESALKWQIEAMAAAWKKTHIALAMNMWKDYENNWAAKPVFVEELIEHMNEVCGARAIIGNNSIGLTDMENDDANDPGDVLYYLKQAFESDNAKIYVQTETVAECIHEAIIYGQQNIGAEMAELPKLKAMAKYDKNYLSGSFMQDARMKLKTHQIPSGIFE